jgi:macrolide transport system ATP-binding/permease protein
LTGASESLRPPLIDLVDVSRVYRAGDSEVRALDGVTLTIGHGEFVAIMGPSGSGKSTLMNILGCLDTTSAGTYRVNGVDVGGLGPDELAALRRGTFGFVFQRYNLLATASAAENVEIPAVYAGRPMAERRGRALELLIELGLGDRTDHRPGELSGGQQQRVSIARALMNDAEVILADEPTGALDSRSSAEVMTLLKELHRNGRTILLITHDAEVAAHADRRVEIGDGRITGDTGRVQPDPSDGSLDGPALANAGGGAVAQVMESVRTALRSLRVNLFRTALTLLGVVIGVSAVVVMLAIGEGSQRDVLNRIEAMGSDLLFVRPGAPGTRPRGEAIASLTLEDARAVAALPNVRAAVPERSARRTLRHGAVDYQTTVNGVSADFPDARNWPLSEGVFFTDTDLASYAAVTVLGATVAGNLFPAGDPIGDYVLMGGVPFQVIGVLEPKGATSFGTDQDDVALVPVTTGFVRLFGQRYLSSITVRVEDVGAIDATEDAVVSLLLARHGVEDFQLRNTAALLATVQDTQRTFALLLGSVAAISLLVGGIGVMNIMLVSVSERTREIGIRMATGARRSDIMVQFNVEALVVGGLGGLIGVAIGVGGAMLLANFGIATALRPEPALIAFGCALTTGLVFGWLPARQASRLDPVAALASE